MCVTNIWIDWFPFVSNSPDGVQWFTHMTTVPIWILHIHCDVVHTLYQYCQVQAPSTAFLLIFFAWHYYVISFNISYTHFIIRSQQYYQQFLHLLALMLQYIVVNIWCTFKHLFFLLFYYWLFFVHYSRSCF